MTYIEFYDKNSIENICACLTVLPKKVILVGSDKKIIEKQADICTNIFMNRQQEVKFSCETVKRWSTADVVEKIEDIIDKNDNCVFGITGGDEIVVFALGIVCERLRRENEENKSNKKIQVHKINIQNNRIHDCDMDGVAIQKTTPQLSVSENVQLYGGSTQTYEWDMSEDFEKDIKKIWNICKKDTHAWNSQIGVIGVIKDKGSASEDGLTITADIGKVVEYYNKKFKNKEAVYHINPIIKADLEADKLISKFEEKNGTVTITFKNKQVKKCLTTAGQALEMKIYLTAKNLKGKRENSDKEESRIYNDVKTGVTIDWDGYEQPSDSGLADIRNEIDVFMMHDMIPVFVSCKNGYIPVDEFYKLNTVAERFGGKYAKKVLVTSSLDVDLNSNKEDVRKRAQELLLRAIDMNIKIITGDDLMDDKQLENKLKNMWS